MLKWFHGCLMILLCLFGMLVTPALANTERRAHCVPPCASGTGQHSKGRMTLDKAVRQVKHRFHGQVIRASQTVTSLCALYHVRMLSPVGRIENFTVSGCSGEIVG